RAGAGLAGAPVQRDGRVSYLERELAGPWFHLLLCGDLAGWDAREMDAVRAAYDGLLKIHHLTAAAVPDALVDTTGDAFRRLGIGAPGDGAQYLLRPDGYIAARCAGPDLAFVKAQLARWLK